MPERAQVFQAIQLGPEVTPGTAVAATKRMLETRIEPGPETPVDAFVASGAKVATDTTNQKEWTTLNVTGRLGFNDIIYLLAMALKDVAPAGNLWTFKPVTFAGDTPKTFTIEHGSAEGAERVAYCYATALGMNFTPQEATVTATLMGQILQEGFALTGGVTDNPKLLIQPKETDVLVGNSVAGLAQLTRCLQASINIRNIRNGLFTLNAADDSYSADVETERDARAQIVVVHNSASVAMMADLRASQQKFCRIRNIGPVLGGGNYSIQITFPFKFARSDRGAQQGAHASTYDLILDYDSTFAGWIEVIVNSGVTGY